MKSREFCFTMHEAKWWRGSKTLKPFKFMDSIASRHKRCNSDGIDMKMEKHKDINNHNVSHRHRLMESPGMEVQNLLQQEILGLQDRLQDQFMVRRALEKALYRRPLSSEITTDKSIPNNAKELIKQVSVLELEIAYLEQYLLSLYREVFDGKQINTTTTRADLGSYKGTSRVVDQEECNETCVPESLLDSSIHRCQSSLSQQSEVISSQLKSVVRAMESYHSLPLSMLEQAETNSANTISLREHLESQSLDLQTPNWLSEQMIKTISSIYCELADPPLINQAYPSSPISYSSSVNEFAPQIQGDIWSSEPDNFSSFNSSRDHVDESEDFNGPYSAMVKVKWICRDTEKLREVQHKLQDFRSFISQLETVDLRKMNREEKLSFWINVHNSLVMHALLVHGIHENAMKRASLVLKAAYNIGGHTINVHIIQTYILGCRLPRPGQWLRMVLTLKSKFRIGNLVKSYSVDHPDPRLYFALCSGFHSDPAVRVYSPKSIFQDLEAAKEEYIQSTLITHNENKLFLPKIVESFAKDSDLEPKGLIEMVEHLLPCSLRKSIKGCKGRKFGKNIEWMPHNFAFRFLISKELVQ